MSTIRITNYNLVPLRREAEYGSQPRGYKGCLNNRAKRRLKPSTNSKITNIKYTTSNHNSTVLSIGQSLGNMISILQNTTNVQSTRFDAFERRQDEQISQMYTKSDAMKIYGSANTKVGEQQGDATNE
jgi:hypothetical protein